MATLLYIRTGNNGGDPAVLISDLGYFVPTGAGWTLLSASSPESAGGSGGQFTARDLRDSADLPALIANGSLEWSKDGISEEPVNAYVADYSLMQDFSDDFFDLSNGRFVTPQGPTLPLAASGLEGEQFWDSDDDALYAHDGSDWVLIATTSGVNNDHGVLTGLADDDHAQYILLSGNEARNQITGSIDMGPSTGYFILPQATDVSGSFLAGSEGALAWDSDDDTLYAHDGTQWFGLAPASGIITDHGALTGLGDDDHTQYHNDTRGDARYYQQSEFIQVSAGAGDGGKPVELLDGVGKISNTMLLVSGVDVFMDRIAGSTYEDAQDMQDLFHSAGWTSGGALTDAGGGNLDVAAGTGLIRDANDRLATLFFHDWASSTGIAIPTDARRYVGIEYNGGSPQIVVKTTDTWNYQTEYPLGCVFNDGGTLEIIQSEQAVGDHAGQMIRRSYETMNIERDDLLGGLVLGETGARKVTLSAGALWQRLNRFAIGALDTSAADTFDAYYRDGGSGFTKVSALTSWPNTQYDDNSGTLATHTASNFGVLWWYLELDGDLVMLYGRGDFATLQLAEDSTAPATLPDRLACGAKLVGRFIYGESDATTTSIESVFTTIFNTTVVTDHGSLSGLLDDDHTQYVDLTGTAARNNVTGDILMSGELDVTSGILTLPQAIDVPATFTSGEEGNIAWDTDDNLLYVHDGTSWVTITSTITSGLDHGQLDGLADDDHSQYMLLSGNEARNQVTGSIDMGPSAGYFILPQATNVISTFTAGSEGAMAWDTDNDTLYAHDGTQWFAIAPASGIISNHASLTGLASDDHQQYGLLAGNAARNPVTGEYDFTAGDLTLPSDGTVDSTPTEGSVHVKGGVLYTYDATRSKWLSADRKLIHAAKKGQANNLYLRGIDGIATSETGYRVLRDGTITGLFAQTDTASSWTMEIRRNGTVTVIASIVMVAVQGNQAITTNVDVTQGDELQFYANTSGTPVKSPVVGLELAWRTT